MGLFSFLPNIFSASNNQTKPQTDGQGAIRANQQETVVPEGMVKITRAEYDTWRMATCDEALEVFKLFVRSRKDYVFFPEKDYRTILNVMKKNKEQEEFIRKQAEINNRGIELEKEGKIEEAISVYEEGVAMRANATHSYTRLMILYHKKKDFANEERIVKCAIEKFGSSPELERRLQRIEKQSK